MFKLHITSLNYVLGLVFVVNVKFPQATYHTIAPSTELYCFNGCSELLSVRGNIASKIELY